MTSPPVTPRQVEVADSGTFPFQDAQLLLEVTTKFGLTIAAATGRNPGQDSKVADLSAATSKATGVLTVLTEPIYIRRGGGA